MVKPDVFERFLVAAAASETGEQHKVGKCSPLRTFWRTGLTSASLPSPEPHGERDGSRLFMKTSCGRIESMWRAP